MVQFDTFGAYDYAEYDPSNPEDVSKPSSLTNDDRKILGKSMPTWYGGWNNTVTFRDFDLNVFFRFSGGNKLMNASRQSSLLNMDFANNGTELLGRWVSPEQPGDGMTPKIGYGDGAALFNDGFSDSHFVENASYLKLATLTLGYTIPKTIVSKLGMSKIRSICKDRTYSRSPAIAVWIRRHSLVMVWIGMVCHNNARSRSVLTLHSNHFEKFA